MTEHRLISEKNVCIPIFFCYDYYSTPVIDHGRFFEQERFRQELWPDLRRFIDCLCRGCGMFGNLGERYFGMREAGKGV